MPSSQPLQNVLEDWIREGSLYHRETDGKIRCVACGHRCRVAEGRAGVCRVRFNEGGRLRVPWGYVAALHLDPIEKKPFFHALPGSRALSFGMLGCDLHCAYCQNWVTSQSLRDPSATTRCDAATEGELVALALERGARAITSTYNEPLITSEWAVSIFRRARAAGLVTSYVSNGNATPEVLAYLKPWVDLYKVDLKGFRDPVYRQLGGVLQNVLETIVNLHRMGFWLEVVTLLVPGLNDSEEEIRDLTQFLASVSRDIPWHVTAFHADYRMRDRRDTAARDLLTAARIGKSAGLNYVYAGNLPGAVDSWENTHCPHCRSLLIERQGFRVLSNRLQKGCCPTCGASIPGFWEKPDA